MHIEVVKPADLTPDQIAAWSGLQAGDARFRSPFFRPEFTLAVGAVRKDVEVAILEDQQRLVGFFPYQRGPGNVAAPVGGRFSDYQGVVVRGDLIWHPQELLKACCLAAWNFDHLLAGQLPLAAFHRRQSSSPYMDVSQGFAVYRATRENKHSNEISEVLRKGRKVGRDIGPLRLETNCQPAVLETLLSWKRAQYRRTGVVDVLEPEWTRALLNHVMSCQTSAFAGMLSAIYFGDRLASIHFDMRSNDTLHGWFSAYDSELSRHSPGSLHLLELARAAESLGLRTIDLGKGDEYYKRRLMTAATPLAEGFVDRRRLHATMKATLWTVRNWVHRSRFRSHVKELAGRLTPLYARIAPRKG